MVDRARLLDELRPPPRFHDERFATYRPDPAHPTQGAAVATLQEFAASVLSTAPDGAHGLMSRWRRRSSAGAEVRGIYLDGGFGVGKTHLLASLWHAAPGPKAYGTFVELTNLVGALGFGAAVEALRGYRLLCLDEFELDDPGDTVLMATLLGRLAESGVSLAATSNTLPGALGEGRFAADDFMREIQALSARFTVVRVGGEDYRHRGVPPAPEPWTEADVRHWCERRAGATLDRWDELCAHLAGLHPSRYGALLDGVAGVGLAGVRPIDDQNVALRIVVLVDRLYDRDVAVATSGERLDRLFTEELLRGGYRKKYLRALSRITALARVPQP